MSLSGSRSRLVSITKELSMQWDNTKDYWKDAKSLEFEHRYLEQLFIDMDKTATVVEKLDELLKRVKNDCE